MPLRFLFSLFFVLFCAFRSNAATLEVVPKIGYGMFLARDLTGPRYDSLRITNDSLRGLSIGYINDENGGLELSWSRANTTGHLNQSEGFPPAQFGLRVEQIHLNAIHVDGPGP